MEHLLEYSDEQIERVPRNMVRYLYKDIHWNNRLIGIIGPRGTGKTTLILQYLGHRHNTAPEAVYLSLDDLYFSSHTLTETVSALYRAGARVIALDEVHKYEGWTQELKNLYDRYPALKMIFTGSSIIDLTRQQFDLSRRAVTYELHGLSYREYLILKHNLRFEPLHLKDITTKGRRMASGFPTDFRPLQYLKAYLEHGYYPFFMEDEDTYMKRLNQVVRVIVEYDMAELKGFDIRNAKKVLQLLSVISGSVPFKPNISELSDKTGINRNTLVSYLHYLEQARLIALLYPYGKSTSTLQKPEKILLNNPNLAFLLSQGNPDTGNLRETFAHNQLSSIYPVYYAVRGDFLVDGKWTFEVGGRSKTRNQIHGLSDSYIVSDEIEYPTAGRIPLWMLGFLY